MTNDKLDKAIALRVKINDYSDTLDQLNSPMYDYFTIHGMCSDGVSDYVDHIPDECFEVIKQWYIDRLTKAKEEFEKI